MIFTWSQSTMFRAVHRVHFILVSLCLRADVSYFLCCTRKRNVCVMPSLIVFQRPAGFPRSWEHAAIYRLTHSAHCLTLRWLVVIESGLIMYGVIFVIGVFQPKQIKTCILVRRPFEILCEATENLTSARKLFLYNLLCMTHHTIFVKSVWENYKSGVDFAPGRHFGESQPRN